MIREDLNYVDSTLSEIDHEVCNILVDIMAKTDDRVTVEKDNKEVSIWNSSRVVFGFSHDKEEVFQNYMQSANKQDITFPILAVTPGKDIDPIDYGLGANKNTPGITIGEGKDRYRTKAKRIQTVYDVSIWENDFKSIRYLQNNLIVRSIDEELLHEYKSKILNDEKLYISSLIHSPSLNVLSTAKDKIRNAGFIYALGFKLDVQAGIADSKLQKSKIIKRINVSYYADDKPIIQKTITGDSRNAEAQQ